MVAKAKWGRALPKKKSGMNLFRSPRVTGPPISPAFALPSTGDSNRRRKAWDSRPAGCFANFGQNMAYRLEVSPEAPEDIGAIFGTAIAAGCGLLCFPAFTAEENTVHKIPDLFSPVTR